MLEEAPRFITRLTLIPSGGGVFEVTIDGDLVWSKKATKKHPTYEQIREAVTAAVRRDPARAIR